MMPPGHSHCPVRAFARSLPAEPPEPAHFAWPHRPASLPPPASTRYFPAPGQPRAAAAPPTQPDFCFPQTDFWTPVCSETGRGSMPTSANGRTYGKNRYKTAATSCTQAAATQESGLLPADAQIPHKFLLELAPSQLLPYLIRGCSAPSCPVLMVLRKVKTA